METIEIIEVAYCELPKGYCDVWRLEDGLFVPSSDIQYFQDLDRSWTNRKTRIEYIQK